MIQMTIRHLNHTFRSTLLFHRTSAITFGAYSDVKCMALFGNILFLLGQLFRAWKSCTHSRPSSEKDRGDRSVQKGSLNQEATPLPCHFFRCYGHAYDESTNHKH